MSAIAPKEFRTACSRFATGVTIITTTDGTTRAGLTANSFSSVSVEPPLVLWSLRLRSRARAVFERAGRFAVNVLAAEQEHLARHFARGHDDPFHGLALEGPARAIAGDAAQLPLIPGALAQLTCRTDQIVTAGDHLIFIGEVEALTQRPGAPLLFYAGGMADGAPALCQPEPGA
ncbi:flavin reductase family protein [Pseudooceanicola sp. 502str34]|uniref:flavin reductase family protein n=1 Tax=Maritimibacter alkaliphilus TaxID=404236 RepID=UPI001C9399B7|nr:flavin reductase family protein [Maritimibacter alkaliphilus]MBY6091946.1 flavin reductase family protein [Maritimibacter alkaliphilus]